VTRRARAAGFAAAAALCAGLAASATGGGRADLEAQLGELREVVVAAEPLRRGRRLSEKQVARALELRRVPARFVPPDAIGSPADAVGRAPLAPVPAGSYLVASLLGTPGGRPSRAAPLGAGRRPVEIGVQGAGAIGASGGRVDVVVTTAPGPGAGPGRTYVAARSVALLDLRPEAGGGGAVVAGAAGERSIATLALTRAQALRLIQAESFARSVRLIGR
jgi:Flp pilus assembly protein CpaB